MRECKDPSLIDWSAVSNVAVHGQHTPENCKLQWINRLRPDIKKKKMDKQEVEVSQLYLAFLAHIVM